MEMTLMWGLPLGLAIGIGQLALLERFTRRVMDGKLDALAVALVISQLFLPVATLLTVAFAWRAALLWTGVGLGAALVIGGFVRFFLLRRGGRR
jgi:hypothetical protein